MAQPVRSVSFSAATALRDNRYVSKRRALARADFFCARPSQDGAGCLSVAANGSGAALRVGRGPPPLQGASCPSTAAAFAPLAPPPANLTLRSRPGRRGGP